MEIPTFNEFREMEQEEREQVGQRLKADENVDEISVFQEWYQQLIDENRGKSVDKPSQFAEGADITISLIKGDEKIRPITEWGGLITEASPSELHVTSQERDRSYFVDLDALTVTREDPDSAEYDLFKLQIRTPPWESEFDTTPGVSMVLIHSDYSMIHDGPFVYPPEEFYEDNKFSSNTTV